MCTTKTYTLTNLPSNVDVSWSVTPTNYFTYSSGWGPSATLTAVGAPNGNFTLTFLIQSLDPNCTSESIQVSHTIHIGKPGLPGTVTGPTSPNIGNTVGYFASSGAAYATSYNWYLPNGACTYCWSIYSNNGLNIQAIVGDVPGYVQIAGVNSCGAGNASSLYVTPTGTPGCNPCQIINPFPNPGSDEINVEFDLEKTRIQFNDDPELEKSLNSGRFDFDVEYFIHDEDGNLKMYYKSNETRVKLDISALTEGTYILTVNYGNKGKDTSRIIVSR